MTTAAADLVSHGPKVSAFAERFVIQTKGRWAGEPLRYEPWQRDIVNELYLMREGKFVYREAMIGVARKNGKSVLAASLALHALLAMGEQGAEVYAAAASRDQARVVFDQARAFVEASPRLQDWLKPQKSVILCPSNGGVFRVLSSDAPLQHGLNPSMVVIDELHAHRDPELYYALTTGQLARLNPLIVSITTAGFDRESICYDVFSRGKEIAEGGLSAMRESGFFFRWFQAPDDCDIDDEDAWADANPSSWIDPEDLRRERIRLPAHVFRRLHLNQWVSSDENWLPSGAWEGCRGDARIPNGGTVVLGVDLGLKNDSAAIMAVYERPEDGRYAVKGWAFYPPVGEALRIATIENKLRELGKEYDVRMVMYDPWRFERSAQMLDEEGLPMIEHPMTNERMAPASEHLFEAITTKKILHDGDSDLARHVDAGVTVETERGWRLTKRRAKDKIDLLIALVLAFNGMTQVKLGPVLDIDDYRITQL